MILKSIQSLMLAWLLTFSMEPSEHRGQVRLGGLPVPGALVTATQNDKKLVVVTDDQGAYSFPDLADGLWTIQVEMLGFTSIKKDVTVAPDAPGVEWELKILPIDEIRAIASSVVAPAPKAVEPANAPAAAAAPASDADDLSQSAADGLLINGSVNNGAASPFAQAAAFGNNRRTRAVYTGGINAVVDNSAFDARSYSLTGLDSSKPGYNHFQGGFSLGGPLRIPRNVRNSPNFFFAYQRSQNRNADSASRLMPTLAERNGDFSARSGAVIDPATGAAFPGNRIPANRIAAEARALLGHYPLPNFDAGSRFNYQVPLLSASHQDSFQSRLNKTLNIRNQLNGDFNFQRTASDNPSAFGFLDTSHVFGFNASAGWNRRIGNRASITTRYQFSRQNTRIHPNFANRRNVSGDAGINGNNQDPLNWGPPALLFSSGIAGLTDAQFARNRNQTHAVSFSGNWNRPSHGIQYGGDFRRVQFNVLSQQDPRGTLAFTGAATGYDFADFLLGVPTTSSIAFGNADKYFRQGVYDAFFTDDWRVRTGLTLNLGVRWEYEAPLTEKYGRIVNLDIAPGFKTAAAVVSPPLKADRSGIQPRLSLAWRPLPASSMVIRAGYGIYRNSSVYQSIVTQMAQQAPLSKSLSVGNTPAAPLTLANAFSFAGSAPATFAVDPGFKVGYAQVWNATMQRDLPASLMMVATYSGTKGSHLLQKILPNTYPAGTANPCPTCPSGFEYLMSNGGSSRQSGQIQLRRRLHNGLTANVQYTLSKSMDDAGFSAANPLIVQDWLNFRAEHAPSSFDQRHQTTAQVQYTTGMGARGGALMSGWRGRLFKEWTILSQITAGSGLPLTPIYPAPVRGTGVTGSLRPDYNGGPPLARSSYAAPATGRWGNAARNSMTGPRQFMMNASLSRTIRSGDRINTDIRIDATNVLNHVTFPNWNTVVTSAQFGLPTSANPMRRIQTAIRVRF